jgi:diguanylate cyclase (GGDEF)-like protein
MGERAGVSPVATKSEEDQRQAALDGYGILDTPDEEAFNDITRLAAFICGTPTALISFVDRGRQWFKARYGFEARETPRVLSFCARAIETPEHVMVVPDATCDPRFADNPLVTQFPKIRLYAGAPMVSPDGAALGTICVIDQAPRELSAAQVEALEILARQVVAMLELRRSHAALEAANAKLAAQSLTDALTCIPNRRAFVARLAEEEARARRNGDPLALLLIDVDHFKAYNDAFGHPAGDEALFAVGQMLTAGARSFDFTARYGGEEFAIILPRTNQQAALAVAERLCRTVAGAGLARRKLTLSIGVGGIPPSCDAAEMIRAADRALYQAKAHGRNRVAASWLERPGGQFAPPE